MEQLPIWPVHPRLQEGELFTSWFIALAHGNGFKVQSFTKAYFGAGAKLWTQDGDRSVPAEIIEALSARTGVSVSRIEAGTLRGLQGVVWEGDASRGLVDWLLPLATRGRKRTKPGLMFCARCFAEDREPYLRQHWRLAWSTVCARHGCMLRDACWKCGAFLDPHRADRWVRTRLMDGVTLATCANCGIDLRRARHGEPASTESVQRQLALEQAMTSGFTDAVGVVGLHSLLFFSGLRIIAKLMLRQTEAAELRQVSGLRTVEGLSLLQREILLSEVWATIQDWPFRFIERCRKMRQPYTELTRDVVELPWWLYSVCVEHLPRLRPRVTADEAKFLEELTVREMGRSSRGAVARLHGRHVGKHVATTLEPISVDDANAFIANFDCRIAGADGQERLELLRDKMMFVTARAMGLTTGDLAHVRADDVAAAKSGSSKRVLGVADGRDPSTPRLVQRWMRWYVPEVRSVFPGSETTPWLFLCFGRTSAMSESQVGARFGKAIRAANLERRIPSYKHWVNAPVRQDRI